MRVELQHIRKHFGPVRANDDISVAFESGRIHAVLGENGAGKSTLMKILSGFYTADSGTILLDGKVVHYDTPAGAIAHGVGMLHQDPLDIPTFSALENFIFGRPGGLSQNRREARAAFVELAQRLSFDLEPDTYVDAMTIGQRQQLEILRLISLGVRVLILDEPTTGISAEQKAVLFASLRRLAHEDGMTVLFVSHKLEEVEELCDDVAVLRQGKLVGCQQMPCPTEKMVAMMFGQDLARSERPPAILGEPVLHTQDLCVRGGRVVLRGVNLSVRAGEVVGLAGLDGSGQKAFMQVCAGLHKPEAGGVFVDGKDLTGQSYHVFNAHGVVYGSAGRLEEGLVGGMTLAEHFALADPKPGRWLNRAQIGAVTNERIKQFNIKGQPQDDVRQLSGGNQQRLLLALMPPNLRLLLLEHPTRGLDVESAAWVWRQLLARRADGTAIVFISADLDEIMEYSDRVLVFFGGQVTEVADPSSITVETLGYLIGGKRLEALPEGQGT